MDIKCWEVIEMGYGVFENTVSFMAREERGSQPTFIKRPCDTMD